MSNFDFDNDDLEFAESSFEGEEIDSGDEYETFDRHSIEKIDNMQDNGENSVSKRIVIFVVVIGFILILVGLGGNRFLVNIKQKLDRGKEKIESVNQANTNNQGIVNESVSSTVITYTPNQNIINDTSGYNDESTKWVECAMEDYGEPSGALNAIFTVYDIKPLFKQENPNDTPIIKYIIEGNITGLVGIFEIEVGYDIGRNLVLGQQLGIAYRTIMIGNKSVVSDIDLVEIY